jgi:outer membrane protein assembly factor BamD (BamD/ComL family)
MKKLTGIFVIFLGLTLNSCGGEEQEYSEQQSGALPELDYDEFSKECQDLEAEILKSQVPNDSLLKVATTKFQDFAGAFPDDPEAPNYLLKASDFSLALNQTEKSVKILDRIIKEYPEYDRMEDVMYVKASHIDLNLRDTTWAKKSYQEFIDKYPNSEMVDDANSRIENISLSIEELAEKFMKELEEQPQ